MKMYELKNYMQLNLGDPNAILKAGPKNTIEQNGVYKGALSSLKRTDAERADNNRAREQLLSALAKAFGGLETYSGVKNGQRCFDDTFLDKLEEVLGKDFKRSDFGINKDGVVTSGKPLTQRRITAIMAKMTEVANKSDNPVWEKKDVAEEKRPVSLGLRVKNCVKDDGSASISDLSAAVKNIRDQGRIKEGEKVAARKETAKAKIKTYVEGLNEENKAIYLESDAEAKAARAERKRKKGQAEPGVSAKLKTFIKDVKKKTDEAFAVNHDRKTEANAPKVGLDDKEHDRLVNAEVERDNRRFAARLEEKKQVIQNVAVNKDAIIAEADEADEIDD